MNFVEKVGLLLLLGFLTGWFHNWQTAIGVGGFVLFMFGDQIAFRKKGRT